MGYGKKSNSIIKIDNKELDDKFSTQLADIVTNAKKYFSSGDADYTKAIRNAYAATPDGGTLYLPAGWYQISDTLTFNRNVNVQFIGSIEYIGTRDKTVLLFDTLKNVDIKLNIIKDISADRTALTGGWHGWINDAYIGVVLRNLKDCDIAIKNVADFNIGVRCLADAGLGFWFNRIKINELTNNKIQLDLCNNGANSWLNSNNFYDTAFSYGSSNTTFINGTFDRVCVNQTQINNTYQNNSANFVNFKFEAYDTFGGSFTAIKLIRATGFIFDKYRNELGGPNNNFCIIDEAGTQSSDLHFCVNGITFNPVMIIGGANNVVQVKNTDLGKDTYSSIYQMLPVKNPYLLVEELDLNKKYRFLTTTWHTVKNLFRKDLPSTDLVEKLTDYGNSDLSLGNGVNISGSYPLVFYITNLSIGDEISVEIEKSDSSQSTGITYKMWDKTNAFCTGGLIGTTKTLSHYGFWSTGNNTENPNTQSLTDIFTVNHANVGTVAILVSGGIKSVKIFSNNRNNITKKTNNTKLEKIDGFLSNVVPAKTTDGYFKPDDIVYYYDGTNVTQYKLVYNAGSLSWVSQGTINM